jgi:hypothetical protein
LTGRRPLSTAASPAEWPQFRKRLAFPRPEDGAIKAWRLAPAPAFMADVISVRSDPVWLEPPSAAGGFHYSESFKKFPKISARLPKLSENRRFLSDSRRKLQEKDYYYQRLMPKWTGGAKKIPVAGRARFTAINHHLKIGLLGAQQSRPRAKRSPRGLPRSKGADKGILRSARLEQTVNENCKLVKKNLIALSARLSGQLGGEAMRPPGSSCRDVL